MEQKYYKYEIIHELLKGDNHVRGIAKALNTNHMMISRKMSELFQDNVVDFRTEGKNKVFFLKKTEECREYVSMYEHYRLLQLLKRYSYLRKMIGDIQKNKKVTLAIIFGSYAKGIAKKDSDIDIYIDTEDKRIKKELSALDSRISIKIGKYDKTNLLIKEIEKNHVIIKGVEVYYENTKKFTR